MKDEHYLYGQDYEIRSSIDRRFWNTSGVTKAVMLGVVDDYGNIVKSRFDPYTGWTYATDQITDQAGV